MTPEQRAAKVMFRGAEDGLIRLIEGPHWHALIAEAITDALIEARGVCINIADKAAIGELMLGSPAAVAPDPVSYPAQIQCPGCQGEASQFLPSGCPVCNGAGIIIDHGPPPTPNPGLVAFKPCGCGVDWVGVGAPPEYMRERIELWAAQGYESRTMDFTEAGPLITSGAGCQHDRRATPRQDAVILDVTDLPPGRGLGC